MPRCWYAYTMTLWHLLRATCFLMPTVAALVYAKHAEVGFGGYVDSHHCCSAGSWGVLGRWRSRPGPLLLARNDIQRHFGSGIFRALYFAAVLWILFTGIVGDRVATIACMFVQRRFTH